MKLENHITLIGQQFALHLNKPKSVSEQSVKEQFKKISFNFKPEENLIRYVDVFRNRTPGTETAEGLDYHSDMLYIPVESRETQQWFSQSGK